VTSTVYTLQFLVDRLGWAVTGGRIEFPDGAYIDLGLPQWVFLLGEHGPPSDAIALNQFTYDYMTSNNTAGLGYPYWQVRYQLDRGIVPIVPQVFG
jgi:hypothetical protein